MKKIFKIIITTIFCIIFASGCSLDPFIPTNPDTPELSACSLINPGEISSSSQTSAVKLSNSVYDDVFNSTVVVYACYASGAEEYSMQSSGFIVGKDNNTHTYYISTSASGIFYRYLQNVGTTFTMEDDVKVVRNGDMEIMMNDGRRYSASLVGYADNIDVAILKFNSDEEYNVVTFGNSDELNIMDEVRAIGTPVAGYNLYNTIIRGYVSGFERLSSIDFAEKASNGITYTGTISSVSSFQFDASLNGGMEGGPVINNVGEVVGVSTYRYGTNSGDNGYESLSFAIPINDLINVYNGIINNGSYSKPLLGVTVTDVINVFNVYTWVDTKQVYDGAYITEIAEGSAADDAFMKNNEVIVEIIEGAKTYKINNLASLYSCLFRLTSNNITVKTINSNGDTTSYNLSL